MAIFSHFSHLRALHLTTGMCIFLTASFLIPSEALAQFGKSQAQIFVAPGKLFRVTIPAGWSVLLPKDDPYTYEFRHSDSGTNTSLFIRRISVPRGANPRQLMLNALEKRLNKLPSLKVLRKSDTPIASYPAATLTARYSYQGNIQFPRVLEETYVVTKREAFIFHFEAFEARAGALTQDLKTFYTTFRPRPRVGTPRTKLSPASKNEPFDTDSIAY